MTQYFTPFAMVCKLRYTSGMFQKWHIVSDEGIKLDPALQQYSSFQKHVATTMDPAYYLVAMMPCYRLWQWLADEIKDFSPVGCSL